MKKVFVIILSLLCFFNLFGLNNVVVYAENNEITVQAKAAILMDYGSGEVLVNQNADEKLEIASMVKLMTIYLVLDEIEKGTFTLSDTLTASENASSMGGSQVFIDTNGTYSVEKMLQSVIMASANDASVALSEFVAGNEKSFVDKMNQKAKELGMNNTQYANATGLPAPMQFSTARDTAIILSNLIQNEIYHKYSSMWMDELVHNSGRKTEIVNTNKLTRYYKGCDCGKTGFTDEAGYCLASSVKRNNMRLISVVMGVKTAKERFSESVNLFNYGFANYSNEILIDSNVVQGQIEVRKSVETQTDVFAKETYFSINKKGQPSFYDVKINMIDSISAPAKKNDVVGEIVISKNGNVIKTIDLILNKDIDCLDYFESVDKIINAWK